jgi:hypothetical protein
MPNWKDIARLSDREGKTREAAFEAEMLALAASENPKPSTGSPPKPTSSMPELRDAIQISVTENGQTTLYDLATVPAPVRERIRNAWGLIPKSSAPPVITREPTTSAAPAVPTSRPRTLRLAMTLNLFVPGAGQFYLGQRAAGAFYASGFCGCLLVILVLFVRGYSQYLQLATSGDILESGNLETMASSFHVGLLIGLSVLGAIIYIISAIHLAVARRRQRPSA